MPDTRRGVESLIGAGCWEFLSLAEASEERAMMLQVAGRVDHPPDDSDFDGWWRPAWLPVVACDAHLLYVDCASARPDGTVPVRCWDAQPTNVTVDRADSWADVVTFWIDIIASGHCRWSAEDGEWSIARRRLPPELDRPGLL